MHYSFFVYCMHAPVITLTDFNLLKFRLDHILYSDHFKCLYSEVQKENFSDHSLLISTFRIKK